MVGSRKQENDMNFIFKEAILVPGGEWFGRR